MKFLSFVQQGVEKSNKSLAAIAEVDSIFEMINEDLKHYPGGELKLFRTLSTIGGLTTFASTLSGVESDHLNQDTLSLSLKVKSGTFTEDVAGWKQRTTGYPCLLKFDGQELSCGTSTHLVNGFSELLASIGFGNAVNRLIQRANSAAADTKPESPLVVVKPSAKPAAKLAARPAVKAAAKPASKAAARSPAYKPAVARAPAAKAIPAKPVAKKPSSKRRDDSSELSTN